MTAPAIRWTTERPIQGGYYWARLGDPGIEADPVVVLLYESLVHRASEPTVPGVWFVLVPGIERSLSFDEVTSWAGPIPEPEL